MRLSTVLRWLVIVSFVAMVPLSLFIGLFMWGGGPTLLPYLGMAMCFLFVCGLAALPCASCYERGRHRALMASGIGAAGATFGAGLTLIWFGLTGPPPEIVAQLATPFFVWGGWCAIVGVLWLRRTTSRVAIWMRRLTVDVAAVLGLVIIAYVWLGEIVDPYDGVIGRCIGILVLLTAVGLVTTILVMRLRSVEGGEDIARFQFSAACPRCGARQSLLTGGATCNACGLRIGIFVL